MVHFKRVQSAIKETRQENFDRYIATYVSKSKFWYIAIVIRKIIVP